MHSTTQTPGHPSPRYITAAEYLAKHGRHPAGDVADADPEAREGKLRAALLGGRS